MNADLEEGFEQFVKFAEIDEHLDSLLATLQRYEETQGKEVQVDIITWRGMMTKIMTVPPPLLVEQNIDSRRRLKEAIHGV